MRRLLFFLCAVLGGISDAADQPNILLILTDDLGPGDLGCYGGAIAATPNLDCLAKENTRFTRYYSAAPICSPLRCGLLTGSFPARWNMTSFLQTRAGNRECEQVDFLDPKAPSLPRQLKAAAKPPRTLARGISAARAMSPTRRSPPLTATMKA